MEAFNRELAKLLFKPMDAQELQDPEKVSTIWVKNLNKIVNNTKQTIQNKTKQYKTKQNKQYSIVNDWYEAQGCN